MPYLCPLKIDLDTTSHSKIAKSAKIIKIHKKTGNNSQKIEKQHLFTLMFYNHLITFSKKTKTKTITAH